MLLKVLRLFLFLRTSEVEEIVRQIYSISFSDSGIDIASSRNIFKALLAQFFITYPSDFTPTADQFAVAALIFDVLQEKCNLLLGEAIDKGILAAHKLSDAFRYNVLQSQLEAIYRELSLLLSHIKLIREAILAFETQYRKQVGQRCSRICPFLTLAQQYLVLLILFMSFQRFLRHRKD